MTTQRCYTEELYMHNQATLAHELKQKYAMWLSCGYSRPAVDVSESAAVKRPSEHLKMDKKNRVVNSTNVKLVSPSVVGQDGKPIIGTLEGHVNGFIYKSHSCSFHTHVLYKNVRDSFFRVGDNRTPPLLHFHLHKDIKVGTEMAKHIQFVLVLTKLDLMTQKKIDEKAQKKTDEKALKKKRKIQRNKDLRSFVEGVEDKWHKVGIHESFESLLKEYEFTGILPPRKTPTAFTLTRFSLAGLVEEPYSVVSLSDIEIVNLAKLRGGIDMTIIFQDLNNVLEIKSIPDDSLSIIISTLYQAGVKYFVNQEQRDWKSKAEEVANDLQGFMERGGWDELEDSETMKVYLLKPDFTDASLYFSD